LYKIHKIVKEHIKKLLIKLFILFLTIFCRKYIRFGEIPENEESCIYQHGEPVGKELGVSVYDACKINKKWYVVLPLRITIDTIPTYECFRMYNKRKVYLVTGRKLNKVGNDKEPLLKSVVILKDLTNMYYGI
jgi:hypothetical protein